MVKIKFGISSFKVEHRISSPIILLRLGWGTCQLRRKEYDGLALKQKRRACNS